MQIGSESPSRHPVEFKTEEAEFAFCTNSYPALRRITCRLDCETVTLRGRVPTYYLKQLAIAEAKKLAGVTQVIDCLDVDE